MKKKLLVKLCFPFILSHWTQIGSKDPNERGSDGIRINITAKKISAPKHQVGQVGSKHIGILPGIRIRFWPRKRIRGSVPQTKGDFKSI